MSIYGIKEVKLYLIFFCLIEFLVSCNATPDPMGISINYREGEAISVDFAFNSDIKEVSLYIGNEVETPILGSWVQSGSKYSFIPLVPFTDGQTYMIRKGEQTLGSFKVTESKGKTVPEILAIYPSTDTVPENLLKLYIKFSEPMQEVGHVLDFIKVIDKTEDKEKAIFLEMESELWNREHDLLTLWLDPGRIKTDLIPNRELGMPILEGHEYSIQINKEWKSAQGKKLKKSYDKSLVVTERDSKKPAVQEWKLDRPKANSRDALNIFFPEPLDAVLSAEALSIYNGSRKRVPGRFLVANGEKQVSFKPDNNWKTDTYQIEINSILEDLAGNNLNRLFDENLATKSDENLILEKHTIPFTVD